MGHFLFNFSTIFIYTQTEIYQKDPIFQLNKINPHAIQQKDAIFKGKKER